uniref:Uncharacterized protein n=1 Tax=Arundo donax TaxID=35708 RepID=A0A0A9EI10_ARUDO
MAVTCEARPPPNGKVTPAQNL